MCVLIVIYGLILAIKFLILCLTLSDLVFPEANGGANSDLGLVLFVNFALVHLDL